MGIKNILLENILKEVKLDNNTGISNEYIILVNDSNKYVLYDYAYQQAIAYASTKGLKSGYISIENVAAHKGFGPIIHDIVMMSLYPTRIVCDEDLTDGSIKIWDYYFQNRNDVSKELIPIDLISDKVKNYNNESLLYSYSLQPNTWFNNLKSKSNIVIEKYNLNKVDIIMFGEYLFNEKYGEYFV